MIKSNILAKHMDLQAQPKCPTGNTPLEHILLRGQLEEAGADSTGGGLLKRR